MRLSPADDGRIPIRPSFGLKLAKESVDQTMDAQGMWAALKSAAYMHELGRTHNQAVFGMSVDPAGLGPGYRKV